MYTKIAKNARHREIPILEQTVKSTVGSWGFGSRDLPGATRRALVFVGIASVCSSLSRGLLIPWPSDTQTLAPLVVPHAHFQSASARACICSCHVESSLPLVALAVPFCVRWTYYHPSSVFILKFSAPLFVASSFFTFLDRQEIALGQLCVLFMWGCVSMYHPRQTNHSNSHASQSALDPHSDDNLQDMHHTPHESELICRPLRFSLSVLSLNAWRANAKHMA